MDKTDIVMFTRICELLRKRAEIYGATKKERDGTMAYLFHDGSEQLTIFEKHKVSTYFKNTRFQFTVVAELKDFRELSYMFMRRNIRTGVAQTLKLTKEEFYKSVEIMV